MKTCTQIIVLAVSIMISFSSTVSAAGFFESLSKAFSQQDTAKEERAKKQSTLPRCAKPLGTITIAPPENQWWRGFNLQSPEALIKLFIQRSGCFTIVDRGRGYDAALRERALSEGGQLQAGSEIGNRRIKAATYILIPDLVTNNQNASGSGVGAVIGIFGGLLGIPGAGLAGAIQTVERNATVTLAITDTTTLEQVLMAEGYAEKSDTGFALGGAGIGGGGFGAAGLGGYANTEAGQIIANAYLDAYQKLVLQMGETASSAKSVADTPVIEKLAPEAQAAEDAPTEAQESQQEETVQ